MLIRIRQHPPVTNIDGLDVRFLEAGNVYEVGSVLGSVLLAEGWAEPVPFEETGVPNRRIASQAWSSDAAPMKPAPAFKKIA
jgi:hypothetical protein